MKIQDANGNIVTVYPYTKAGNVDGLDVFGASGSNHSTGLVPDPGATAGSTKYLREDGTWAEPAGGGGAVDTVYIGSTEYAPDANGKVTLPAYPTTLPASDVSAWAKASSKPSYTASEVGAVPTTRTVNGKALSSNISLTYSDVNAASSVHSHSTATTSSDGFMSSTDKSSLIDIVDNGPKQLVKFNNSTSGALVATVQSNGYSVKITGGDSTGRTVAYALANCTKTGTYTFKLKLSGTGASCYINDDTTGTMLKEYYASTTEDISLTAGHTYSFKTYRKGSGINATVSIMICDKDLYAVSSAYVPYRPSYQELYDRIVALENR